MEPTWVSPCGTVRLYNADCRDVLPTLSGVDAVVTDPPYGCDKAEWDSAFFADWYALAKGLDCPIYTITGSQGLRDSVGMVGDDFVDVIAARNLNGMTRGPIGFGNWLACVVSNGKPPMGPNTFDFSISGDMPDHPSPKPLSYMMQLVRRVSDEGQCLCDCLMGSGTTGVACVRTGRKFIGVEIEPKYFDIAVRRIEAELNRTPLFDAPAPRQLELAQ